MESIKVVPGNGGAAAGLTKVQNVSDVNANDFPSLLALAKEHGINLVVPGPEVPLMACIGDFFRTGVNRSPKSILLVLILRL